MKFYIILVLVLCLLIWLPLHFLDANITIPINQTASTKGTKEAIPANRTALIDAIDLEQFDNKSLEAIFLMYNRVQASMSSPTGFPRTLRPPRLNGRIGPDPVVYRKCVDSHNYVYHKDSYIIHKFIPEHMMLPTHTTNPVRCFDVMRIPNVVAEFFSEGGILYTHGVHVLSGLYVGLDEHFGEELVLDRLHYPSFDFAAFHKYLREMTQPVRDKLTRWILENEVNQTKGSHYAALKTIFDYYSNASIRADAAPRHPYRIFSRHYESMRHLPSGLNIFLSEPPFDDAVLSKELQEIRLPVTTPYVFFFQPYLVGFMPALIAANALGRWARLYSSGVQALGPDAVTVIMSPESIDRNTNSFAFFRYMVLPVMIVPPRVPFFVENATLSHRLIFDYQDPCEFHFLYHWLVPTVVRRIRAALSRRNATVSNETIDRRQQHTAILFPRGIELRMPLTQQMIDVEMPWWEPEFDYLIRNPPESLFIMKPSRGNALSNSDRSIKRIRSSLLYALLQANYTIIPDSMPMDLRLYLVNHARRIMIQWGGMSTGHSALWGGGVTDADVEQSTQTNRTRLKPRTLDVIFYIIKGYHGEIDWYYGGGLKLRGIDPVRNRSYIQDGVRVYLGGPSPYDGASEGPFSFMHAWSKLLFVDDLDKITASHIVITDEEKARFKNRCPPLPYSALTPRGRYHSPYEWLLPHDEGEKSLFF